MNDATTLLAATVPEVNESDLTPTIELVGQIEACKRVHLLARVSGVLQARLFQIE